MANVAEHHASLLGPICIWMSGGIESGLRRSEAERQTLGIPASAKGVADAGRGRFQQLNRTVVPCPARG